MVFDKPQVFMLPGTNMATTETCVFSQNLTDVFFQADSETLQATKVCMCVCVWLYSGVFYNDMSLTEGENK